MYLSLTNKLALGFYLLSMFSLSHAEVSSPCPHPENPDYYFIGCESNGLFQVTQDKKNGFIDASGKLIIPLQYDNADDFYD